jgi:hypothetical protein
MLLVVLCLQETHADLGIFDMGWQQDDVNSDPADEAVTGASMRGGWSGCLAVFVCEGQLQAEALLGSNHTSSHCKRIPEHHCQAVARDC